MDRKKKRKGEKVNEVRKKSKGNVYGVKDLNLSRLSMRKTTEIVWRM